MKSQSPFVAARPWAEYPRISIESLLDRYPNIVPPSDGDEDDEDTYSRLRERYRDREFVFIEGDVALSPARLEELDDLGIQLVVAGNLDVDGAVKSIAFVSGDLSCDRINLTGHSAPIAFAADRTVVARHLAEIGAADDEAMCRPPTLRLETPYLFSWFGKLDGLVLDDSTVVFIMGDQDYCDSLSLPNPLLPGQTSLYALVPELCWCVSRADSNEDFWNTTSMSERLSQGHSIFRDGFDPSCLHHMSAGDEAMAMRDLARAWSCYAEAADRSPGYYLAWHSMGEALYEACDYEQAMTCYRRAAECFPSRQSRLVNGGYEGAALCALRLRLWPEAIEWASRSIAFNEGAGGDWKEGFGFAYRLRGEARLLAEGGTVRSRGLAGLFKKRSDAAAAAEQDLKKAMELNQRHGSTNWVMGLWHFLHGDSKRARTFHDAAKARNECFAPWYDVAPDSNALEGAPTHVDWIRSGSGPVVRDEAYWCEYLEINGPDGFAKVPANMRSERVCLMAIKGGSGWLRVAEKFPATAFTPALAECLVRASGANLRYVPAPLLSKALCLLASEAEGQFDATCLPVGLFDQDVARHAVACGAALEDIPPALLTRELCLLAIRKNEYAIESVPHGLLDEQCYVAAIAFGSPYFFDNKIPSPYKTSTMIKRALDLDKRSLNAISGHAFNEEVFAHARALYGCDADWPEILACHSPMNVGEADAAEICWEALWDERFVLEQVTKKEGYELSSWQIPRHRYSQAVADAVFARNPIHLDKIPRQYIQPWMAEQFGARYPDMLDHIPVALRTPALCAAAVGADERNLLRVPLVHRSADLCYRALLVSSDYEDAIPQPVYAEVFDRLLASMTEHTYYRNWLLQCRGDSYALGSQPNYPRALADYWAILADPSGQEGEDMEYRRQYVYHSVAMCYHRLGEHDQARIWLDKLADPQDWPDLDDAVWVEPPEPVDFDKPCFDTLMHDIDRLKQTRAYALARARNSEAEHMLIEAATDDRVLWAYVLDNKRFLAYEQELWSENESACREAIERLGGSALWHYIDCVFRVIVTGDFAEA